MATQAALVLDTGTYRRIPDADSLGVGAGIVSENGADLLLDAAGSNIDIASGKNLVAVGGASNFDFSGSSGTFDTPSGAVTIGPGAVTLSGATTVTAAGTGLTVDNDMVVSGNLTVSGTTFQNDVENANYSDNFLGLNVGYETVSAVPAGFVANYLPTSTNDTVDTGGFTAGVAATSNPTVATVGAATFAASDIIQITGAADPTNNGLFEVLSQAANVLTIRGVGTTSTVEAFSQNQFATDATVQGTIRKVTVGVLRIGTDGVPETGSGSVTGITYSDLATAAGATLQSAYEAGNTITTSGGEGEVTIAGTEDFVIGGSVDVNWTSSGNLLIADNTADAFVVSEAAVEYLTITTTDASEAMDFGNTSNNPAMNFLGSGTKTFGAGDVNVNSGQLFVDVSASFVGINNASPAAALDVIGDIAAQGRRGTTKPLSLRRSTS
jgi:hypothetical protein